MSHVISGIDTGQSATYDFLLVIHSNYVLSGTVSEMNGYFGRKLHNFHSAVYLTNPLRELPLEFCNDFM